jgi:hypothetical protein
MDDIRTKVPRVGKNPRKMPPVGEVEAQVLLDRKRECATRQLKRAYRAIFAGAIRRTCPNAEKGQTAAAGEGLKVPAGVRHPVDFVEGVREVSDSGDSGGRRIASGREHSASVCGARRKRKVY